MTKKATKPIIIETLSPKVRKRLAGEEAPASYLHGGVSCRLSSIPENIIIWAPGDDHSSNPPNLHHRHLLIVNLQGRLAVGVEKNIFELKEGEAVLIFPRQLHYYLPADGKAPRKRLCLSFETRGADHASLLPLKDCVTRMSEVEKNLLGELLELYFCGGKKEGLAGDKIVLAFSMLLSSLLDKAGSNPAARYNAATGRLAKILAYIYENYSRRISLKDIAEHVSMSESHLRQFFRKETKGLSAGKFLREVRLYKSYELLAHSNMSVSEIAYACGFSDPYVYSRAAKRKMLETPSAYRKIVRRLDGE